MDNSYLHDEFDDVGPKIQLPTELAGYRIGRLISRGRLGVVCHANHIETDLRAVVKLYPIAFAVDEEASKRFQREVKILASLSHPNIIAPLCYGEEQGYAFAVLPWIAGSTFRELCREEPIAPKVAVRLILDASRALAYAHSQGVIHRDIKAENLMIDQDSRVFVLDFGVASFSQATQTTQLGDLVGTPYSMSPEQASGDLRKVDQRSDIYSLGVVLYFLLSQHVPIQGKSPNDTLRLIAFKFIVRPSWLNHRVPVELDTICLKCLEKNPARRYQTANMLCDDLQRFLDGQKLVARPKSFFSRTTEVLRLNRGLAIFVSALILLAVTTSYLAIDFYSDSRRDRENAKVQEEYANQFAEQAEEERRLRKKAKILQDQAVDAERLAREENIQAVLTRAQSQMTQGDYVSAVNSMASIDPMKGLGSFDTKWVLERIDGVGYELTHQAFGTSDRSLYDAKLSPNQEILATVDRCGEVSAWNISTGQRIQQWAKAEVHKKIGTPFTRWHYHAGETYGFSPSTPPKFFGSIDWQDENTIVLGGLDGSLYSAALNQDQLREVYHHSAPIHWVRVNPSDEQLAVADSQGKVLLLNQDFQPIGECLSTSPVTLLKYFETMKAWCLADQSGKIVLLDRQFNVILDFSGESNINDVEIAENEGVFHFFVVSKSHSVTDYLIDPSDPSKLVRSREFYTHDHDESELQKTVYLSVPKLLVAIDSDGKETHWDYASGKIIRNYSRVATHDRRSPNQAERSSFDLLESRSPWSLAQRRGQLMCIDCIGSLFLFDLKPTQPESSSPDSPRTNGDWRTSKLDLGPKPSIAMHPSIPHIGWTLNERGTLSVLDVVDEEVISTKDHAHSTGTGAVRVTNQGEAITVGSDSELKRWRLEGTKIQQVGEYKHQSPLKSLAFHEGRNLVAAVSVNGELVVWDMLTFQKLYTLDMAALLINVDIERSRNKIHSGSLAFSKQGEYLAVGGPLNFFEVFSTRDFSRKPLALIQVGGKGCVDVCFSPLREEQFVVSDTNTLAGNYLLDSSRPKPTIRESLKIEASRRILATYDQKRILSLTKSGIDFYTSEHFVYTASIPFTFTNPYSMAIGAEDQAIYVCDESGRMHFLRMVGTTSLKNQLRLQGEHRWIVEPGSQGAIVNFQRQYRWGSLGANGYPQTLMMFQSTHTAPKFPAILEHASDWEFRPILFDGRESGELICARLSDDPSGQNLIVARQRMLDKIGYAGRLLLLRESKLGRWDTTEFGAGGNNGFDAVPQFDSDGTLKSILHFDFQNQRLVQSKLLLHGTTASWETRRGSAGINLNSVKEPDGKEHFLMNRLRGYDAIQSLYMTEKAPGEFHFENARGLYLYKTKNQQLYSWDHASRKLFMRLHDGAWREVAMPALDRHWLDAPIMDTKDRLWFSKVNRGHVSCLILSLSDSSENHSPRLVGHKELQISSPISLPENGTVCAFPIENQRIQCIIYSFGTAGSILTLTSKESIETLD